MEPTTFAPRPQNSGEPWGVIIIGSGPAAFTAAIYTTRGAVSTLILGGEKWGGQLMLTTTVDNWPAHPGIQGPDLMTKMRDHALLFGAEFKAENVSKIEIDKYPFEVFTKDRSYFARSVIVATGAETKWLNAPGVSEFIGKGVSSCAPCDAPFFKDKKVAVVGGGDSAMEEALVLSKYAKEVLLVHRRDEFRASPAMVSKVQNNPEVQIFHCSEVLGVYGEKVVTGINLKSWKQSKFFNEITEKIKREGGTVNKEDNEFIYWNVPLDGLFVAIGHKPASDIFIGKIELDESGYIKIIDHTKTSAPGVFVAGDVHDSHYRQAITAAGFGCMAGMDVIRYLEELKTTGNFKG